MARLKCPHCGRKFSQRVCRPLVPTHTWWKDKTNGVSVACPGSQQMPIRKDGDK